MKRWQLSLGLLVVGATLVSFQNCSSSLPADAANFDSSAAVKAAQGCFLDKAIVDDGTVESSVYQTDHAPLGSSCAPPSSLTCKDGNWFATGSSATTSSVLEAFSVCTANGSCTVNNVTIASGSTAPMFSAATVASGQSCTSVQTTVSCENGLPIPSVGSLSDYTFSSCSVAAPVLTWTSKAFSLTDVGSGAASLCASASPGGKACSTSGALCFVSNSSTVAEYVCQ